MCFRGKIVKKIHFWYSQLRKINIWRVISHFQEKNEDFLLIFDENKKIICLSIRHMHLYKSQKNTLNTHLLLSTFRNHYFRRYISVMCLFFLSKTPHITLQILIFRSWEYQEWIFWTFLRLKDKFNPCFTHVVNPVFW